MDSTPNKPHRSLLESKSETSYSLPCCPPTQPNQPIYSRQEKAKDHAFLQPPAQKSKEATIKQGRREEGRGKEGDLADGAGDLEGDGAGLHLRSLGLLLLIGIPPLGFDLLLPPRHLLRLRARRSLYRRRRRRRTIQFAADNLHHEESRVGFISGSYLDSDGANDRAMDRVRVGLSRFGQKANFFLKQYILR